MTDDGVAEHFPWMDQSTIECPNRDCLCGYYGIPCIEVHKRLLGHTTMDMTRHYVALTQDDIQTQHDWFTRPKTKRSTNEG